MNKQHKISFCITCKGRLHHLKQTLPKNLRNAADYPNAEFVVLDYDSKDGLEQWMKEHFQDEISSGRIRYAKIENKPHFHIAHAKNVAHRIATGEILCNLDADNTIAPDFANWLNEQFLKDRNIYMRIDAPPRRRFRPNRNYVPGKEGRIVMHRDDFMQLHGYDEKQHEGWSGDDANLDKRATLAGFKRIQIPLEMHGEVIKHSDAERVEHFHPDTKKKSAEYLQSMRSIPRRILRHLRPFKTELEETLAPPPANTDGNYGCGTICINWQDEVTLEPVRTQDTPDHAPDVGQSLTATSYVNKITASQQKKDSGIRQPGQ